EVLLRSVSPNPAIPSVRLARCERPVINLQYVAAIVVAKSKNTQLRIGMGRGKFACVGAINNVDIHLAHAVRLPYAAGSTPGHKRQIRDRSDIAGKMQAVETAPDIGPVSIRSEERRVGKEC